MVFEASAFKVLTSSSAFGIVFFVPTPVAAFLASLTNSPTAAILFAHLTSSCTSLHFPAKLAEYYIEIFARSPFLVDASYMSAVYH